jgi:hypothetical protein
MGENSPDLDLFSGHVPIVFHFGFCPQLLWGQPGTWQVVQA